MPLPSKNITTIVLIVSLLIAVLFAGTFLSEPKSEQVTQKSETIDSSMSLLTQENKNRELEKIKSDLKELTGAEAYQAFKERNTKYNHGVQHEYAHLFGQELYNTHGTAGVAVCDSMFAFGCFHSFFGRALIENGLDIVFELEEACIEAFGPKGLGCQHGIGHGVLAEVGPEELELALKTCSKLQWKGPVGGCTSGVFMEYNFNIMNNTVVRELNPQDVYYPCEDVDEMFSHACYYELAQWWESSYRSMFQIGNGDVTPAYEQIAKNCADVTNAEYRVSCYRGFGNTIGGTRFYTTNEIIQHCALAGTDEGKTHCLEGAAWLLSWEPEYEDTWKELCADLTDKALEICLGSKSMI